MKVRNLVCLAACLVAVGTANAYTQQWYSKHGAGAKAKLASCREKVKSGVLLSGSEREECQRASNAEQFEVYVPKPSKFSSAGGTH